MTSRPTFRFTPLRVGFWGVVFILLFIAVAYSRPFTWAVLVRSPAAVAHVCGEGRLIDLVHRDELTPPPAEPYARSRVPEWFACRTTEGVITTDSTFHIKLAVGGGAVFFLVLLAMGETVRIAARLLLGTRAPDGSLQAGPLRRLWDALPDGVRHRIQAGLFAAGVGCAAAVLPVALTLHNLHRIPGAATLICESGRLDPYGYHVVRSFGSSRGGRQIACLDARGQKIVDEALHEAVAKTIYGVSWGALALLLYPVGLALMRQGRWRQRTL